MNSLVGEERANLKTLYESGCCVKCALYLIAFPTFDIFLKLESEITTAFGFEYNDKRVCSCCLGIFQDHIMFELLPKITKEKISNFEHDKYEKFKNTLKYTSKKILSNALGFKFDTTSGFEISINFTHPETDNEHKKFIIGADDDKEEQAWKKKKTDQRQTHQPDRLKAIETAIQKQQLKNFECFCPPPVPTEMATLFIDCLNAPLYITGNYNKYERGVSQTQWIVNDERIGDSSVGEVIAKPFIDLIKATSFTFHSSGREDIDVRMLGGGRPFVLEFCNPKLYSISKETLLEIEKEINTNPTVGVNGLHVTDESIKKKIEEGAQEKRKEYRCVVWTSKILTQKDIDFLNGLENVKVSQKTPIRVLHRRSLDSREKLIVKFKAELVNDHFMVLDLQTQAGTYIKEFVHGDFGRSSPSIGELLNCEADIIQLDVIGLIF